MTSLARKFKRNKDKKLAKEAGFKVSLFNKLPNKCDNCSEAFDKKNKEMVQSWHVMTFEEPSRVNLICPPCWDTAIEDFKLQISKELGDFEQMLTAMSGSLPVSEGEENA